MRRFTIPLLAVAFSVASGAASAAAQDADPALFETPSSAVRPGDVLQIRVWPEGGGLSGDYPVEETGFVYLPVVGQVRATGHTLSELRSLLREAFGEVVKTPVVSITPLFRVTVMGEVRSPGLYAIDPTVAFYDLITRAGGFTDRAKEDKVRFYRDGEIYTFDASNVLSSGDFSTAPLLQSGDRILVPRGFAFSWTTFRWTVQLLGTGLTLERLYRKLK